MTGLTLASVSSLRRDLGDSCTVLRINGDRVFAGSQEGTLICWMTDSGERVWKVSMSGPLSDIDFSDGRVYVAESSMIYCLNYDSGEIIWSSELEGSSDYIVATDTSIWATSSVYEIEVGDYTESTIWKFDIYGELEHRWTIAERCWFFSPDSRGLVLGLGRPRCGMLRVDDGQLDHLKISNSGPVTCGSSDGNRILLGHSDGRVSAINGLECTSTLEGGSPVSIALGDEGVTFAGFEGGGVMSSIGWSYTTTGAIDTLSLGPSPSSTQAVWACSDGDVLVLGRDSGDPLLELRHDCRIFKSNSNGDLIVLGDSEGIIHFVERDVLSRRLEEDSANIEVDAKKREMMDRLRGLRVR